MDRPGLSVVVTVVEGAPALRRCLEALASQSEGPSLEVLVPLDPQIADLAGLATEFGARVVDVPGADVSASDSEARRHELYDRRRSCGIAEARGDVVALIEDRCVPRPDWSGAVSAAHRRAEVGALGGAVEPRARRVLDWAVYFSDYGRYQLPFEAGSRAWVSDVNVSYRREVLEETRSVWEWRYNEAVLHGALARRDLPVVLDPSVVVEYGRASKSVGATLSERFHWGRVFGGTRLEGTTLSTRLLRAVLAPVVPWVVWVRLLRQRFERRGRTLGAFLRATPVMLLCLGAWSLGEAAAYATGRGA